MIVSVTVCVCAAAVGSLIGWGLRTPIRDAVVAAVPSKARGTSARLWARPGIDHRRSLKPAEPPEASAPTSSLVRWRTCEEFPTGLAQYETVFWEPGDAESLRKLIRETDLVAGKTILEIGTETGLVALCCAKAGAERIVATDISGQSVANARYNASRFSFGDRLELRLVSPEDPSAYAVIVGSRRRCSRSGLDCY